jgi:hypothetical protein
MGWGVLMVLFGRRGVSYSFKECFRATLIFIMLGVTTIKSFLTTNKKNPPQNNFSIGIPLVGLSIKKGQKTLCNCSVGWLTLQSFRPHSSDLYVGENSLLL